MPEKQIKYLLKPRLLFLDLLRGFTVILMVIFHFSYDIAYFKIVEFDIIHHPFWYLFPRVIVFLFLYVSGVALAFQYKESINWNSFLKRQGILGSLSLIVSLATYIFFPDRWIYFGTLHAIFTVSFMCLPFLNWPKISLATGLTLFIPSIFFDFNLPWWRLPHPSLDYISPFPWMGAMLFGFYSAHTFWTKLEGNVRLQKIFHTPVLFKSLNILGRHSLLIYIVHQPLLFSLFHSYFFISLKLKALLA